MLADSPRQYLEREVGARASHGSKEHVRTTCSFARAERLLGREYHGRFLIELLQNAPLGLQAHPQTHLDPPNQYNATLPSKECYSMPWTENEPFYVFLQ